MSKFSRYNSVKVFVLFIIGFMIPSLGVLAQVEIPEPPKGFDKYNSEIEHGSYELVNYYSSTVGKERKTKVFLPPGYTEDSTYNVLYLLHGIGGDVNEWSVSGAPNFILDNLLAKGKIAPMIVVLPNGRAMEDDSPGSDIYAADKVQGFADFEFELITDLIPFIDTTYSVNTNRESRALAGLSMGGGQSLNFGLAHLDTFAWVGAFSPAPNTNEASQLIPNIEQDSSKIALLWISCGGADGLLFVAENIHNFMAQNNIEHNYWIQPGKGHDWSVWKPGLYHFSQRIFGKEYVAEEENNSAIYTLSSDAVKLIYNEFDQTILFNGSQSIVDVRVFDISGRLIISKKQPDNNLLEVYNLNNGVYIVSFSDGKNKITDRFIKR